MLPFGKSGLTLEASRKEAQKQAMRHAIDRRGEEEQP
jgi:hypothetical protein